MAEKRLTDIEKSDRVREKDCIIAIIDGCLRKVERDLIDGKSAYEYATEVGFTGTEEEFAQQLMGKSFADVQYDEKTGYLHFYDANGEDAYPPVHMPGAGNSGGNTSGGNNATMTIANTTGWNAKSISENEPCEVSFTWSSVENDMQTGPGTLSVMVNGSVRTTRNIEQGDNKIDVKEYLSTGSNIVRLTVSDVYGNNRLIVLNVNVTMLTLTSPFDDTKVYKGDITFPFVATGETAKMMQFILDGTLIGSTEVTTSGIQRNFTIPAQSHGSHTFEVYFTAEVNGNIVKSNPLFYDIMFEETGNNDTIIASPFNVTAIQQYYTVMIPHIIYTPNSLTTDVVYYVNGEVYSEQTVDRTTQIWSYRSDVVGRLLLEIEAGGERKAFDLTVNKTDIDVSAEENDLGLYLTSYGRSNNEANPGVWQYGDISTVFNDFNFVSDGWQLDDEGNTVLRIAGDARLQIPYEIFASDFRSTGKTIEFEIATRDVLNYDATMLSCMSGERGIEVTTQMAQFKSELSEISTKYKEEEHIRVSFVVEKKSSNKLLYLYINGVMTRCCLYSDDDDFSQALPVDITIGSNDCITDIYNIRVYDNDLTRYQMLDNWIADTQSGAEKKERFDRNNVYDVYGKIKPDTLKKDVPYLVLVCPVLPKFKGDKKTCSGYYVDPVHPERSFTFEGAQIDVQGTSSQYYWIKNIKVKFTNGVVLEGGTLTLEYKLNGKGVGTFVFTMKADVASSEGFLNLVLAQLFNDLCPVKTPAQEDNPDVRQTIDGHPMVIFHDSGNGPEFYGKFNFNHDKGTPEVFGFEEGDESWEILQNGTDRVGFKSADFSGDDWKNDFEARYPEDNTDTTRLQEFAEWIASTNTDAASGELLEEEVTYDDVTYTHDTADYRLAKFRNELENYAIVDSLVFYYLFTLVFLCIDQREKNMFPTWIARLMRWIILFYDADSSMGTDNKGRLTFDYWMEDIDFTDAGDPVFNGQNSVLWKNMRACFWDEITAEYIRLRTTIGEDGLPLLGYDTVMNKIRKHVRTWCEAIYNEDAYKKYIEPYILNGDASYFDMLRGDKLAFIEWWMFNRFRYMDSLFATGTSKENRIMIRAHAKADVKLTSYVNMVGRVYYNAMIAENRMFRGVEYTFPWNATGAEDAVIGINDADMLTSIGDLSPLMPETIDASKGTHLTYLKFGDSSPDYINNNLTTVTLGYNRLLRYIGGWNCPKLAGVFDASGCTGLEEAYFTGTSITYVKLPNGGNLRVLHLPETISNLTLMNLTKLEELVVPTYENITTLRLENIGDIVDTFEILKSIPANSRVRIIGFDWAFESAEEILSFYDLLDTMRGLDESGNNMDMAQMMGTIHVYSLTSAELYEMKTRYSSIEIVYDELVLYTVRFYNGETLLRTVENVAYNESVEYTGETPIKDGETDHTRWAFDGWSPNPIVVTGDMDCYAQYKFTGSFARDLVQGALEGSYTNHRITTIGGYVFVDCTQLTTLDVTVTHLGIMCFAECTALTTLILRNTDEVCTLHNNNLNPFTGTPIASGTGYIYVPKALVDSYKVTAGWVDIADQIRAIEDYPEICGGE